MTTDNSPSENWVSKHRPETFKDLQGNNQATDEIAQWADNWSPGDPPILLVGVPGTGKTSTAYILQDYLDCPLNQINASDQRKSDDIAMMARTMRSSPADDDKQLVLLDEVDNWHGSVDKQPLYDALKDPRNPVILTANDEYETPDPIKRASETFEFKLGVRSRKAKLKEIAEREDVDLDDKDLERLADRPDLRSAINDLQTWSKHGVPPGSDDRQWEMNDFSSVTSLLQHGDEWEEALSVHTGNKGLRPEWAIMWADENLRNEFRGLEVGVAYNALSLADIWVRRGQGSHARGLPYAGSLLRLLPETRLSEIYEGYISVDFPNWVRSKEAKHDDGSPEAELFSQLKPERGYRFSGSFAEFRQTHLPILKDLPEEDRFGLILNHGLDEDAMEGLGVDPDEYLDWAQDQDPETGEWSPDTQSAADW